MLNKDVGGSNGGLQNSVKHYTVLASPRFKFETVFPQHVFLADSKVRQLPGGSLVNPTAMDSTWVSFEHIAVN